MKRRARWIVPLIIVALIGALFSPFQAFAFEGGDHDADLERLLFGDSGVSYANSHRNTGDVEGRAIVALEDAAYLCIDQYGRRGPSATKGYRCIEYLRGYVWLGNGIPRSLGSINPASTGMAHRSYTHQGWNHNYGADATHTSTKDSEDHAKKWNARKTILLNTVDRVFGFTPLSLGWLSGHGEKCESLCALIYYVHVLGDYIEDSDYSQFYGGTNGQKIPFAVPNASDKTPDIFWELDKHLEILFGNQAAGGRLYASLDQEIDTLANRARRLAGSRSTMSEDEAYSQGHEQAIELMAILTGYDYGLKTASPEHANRVHELLMNEEWFTNAFPSL